MDSKGSCSPDESWSPLVDSDGYALSTNESSLVKMAVESAEGLPVRDGTNSRMAYYVTYKFKYANGVLNLIAGPSGWNMGIEALDKLKEVEPIRYREHYKSVKVVYHDDYVVYLMAAGIVIVSQFNKDNEYVLDTDGAIFPKNTKELLVEAEAIEEFMTEPSATNDLGKEKESTTSSTPNKEESLISKAVEKVKSMSVGNVVNADAPYFTKCEFSIWDNDIAEGRPFARNIDTDKLEGIKESHKRCAETYKASYVSCGADYTAYIYNEGKSMCVYCYHSNEAQG